MEVFEHRGKSDHPDISWGDGPSSIESDSSIWHTSANLSMNDLNACLAKCLTIEDGEISTGGLNPYLGKNDTGNEDNRARECKTSEKCLSKSVTFPLVHGSESFEGVILGEEAEHNEVSGVHSSTKPSDQRFLRSVSLPVPLKLVSAMKGSREKSKNLSVTWAPDVYDPIPTSVSHVPSNAYLRGKRPSKYKKNGGKYSRGSNRGKERKQEWKNDLIKMKSCNQMRGGVGSSVESMHRAF